MARFFDTARLNRRAILFLPVILLASACSDEGDVMAPAPTPALPTVTGTVVDSATGDPISGARVSLGAAAITTGPDGRFELSAVDAGPAILRCSAAGYQDFEADITVPSGRTTREISLTPLLHVVGGMDARSEVIVLVDRAGRDVIHAVVTVNGVAIPYAGDGSYRGALPEALPVGSPFVLRVTDGGVTVEAIGSVPEPPVITVPATGSVFAFADSITFTWTSATDPDWFNGPFGPTPAGVRTARIAARDIACDFSGPFPDPCLELEEDVTRAIAVTAVRNLSGQRDFSGPADPGSSITLASGSEPVVITITTAPALGDVAVYDLTAWIESFDPAWGIDMEGGYYSAVVTLSRGSQGGGEVAGTFADWRVVLRDWEAVVEPDGTGLATGSIDPQGESVVTVDRLGWYMRGVAMDSGDLVGTWFCCGHIGGTFLADRRGE